MIFFTGSNTDESHRRCHQKCSGRASIATTNHDGELKRSLFKEKIQLTQIKSARQISQSQTAHRSADLDRISIKYRYKSVSETYQVFVNCALMSTALSCQLRNLYIRFSSNLECSVMQ